MAKYETCVTLILISVYIYHSLNSNTHQEAYNSLTPTLLCSTSDIPKCVTIFCMTKRKTPIVHLYAKGSTRRSQLYLALILIAHSMDVETNPGPQARRTKFPCQICTKAVTWAQKGVACDDCEGWYHTKCMGMKDAVYLALENISWHCVNCGMPNFSSSLFDSVSVDTFNSFQSLDSSTPSPTSNNSFNLGQPQHTSSPISNNYNKKEKTTNVRVLIVNFQSAKNKTAEIGNLMDSADPDIIIGNETWLNKNIHSSEIFPSNYEVFRKDREDGYGGVLLAVKKEFTTELIEIKSKVEAVFCKISLSKNQTLVIGSLYRPPSNDKQYMEELCNVMQNVCDKYKKSVIWMGGDMNLPDINWDTLSLSGCQYSQDISYKFMDSVNDCNFEQKVNFPTRQDKTLDIFLTNRPSLINRSSSLPGLADHDIVHIDSHIRPVRSKPVRRKIHLWKKADIEELRQKAHEFQTTFIKNYTSRTCSSVQKMWEDIKIALLDILNTIPSKMTSQRYNQPWINTHIKRLTRKKKKSYNKARRTKKPADIARFKRLKKDTQTACKKAFNTYVEDLVDPTTDNNPKKFWSYINSKKCESTGVAPLKSTDGITHPDNKTKANILNTQFTSVFNKNESKRTIKDKGPSPHPAMPKINVTEAGVEKLLHNLNPHKATGPDQVPTRLLKELACELAPVFTIFFQTSIDNGTIPEEWKSANVVPIFKKGDKNKAANYRPVSLTSVTCKLLEHILSSSIMKHLDKNSILSDTQHGFRKRRSCESQLILTIQDIAKNTDNKEQTDIILLDFSKAFDKVPHHRLLYKLEFYGIRGTLHSWLSDFLSSRTQQVILEGATSSTTQVLSGVPQGSVLGPILFLLYINDLPDFISQQTVARLFADDCILSRKIKTVEDAKSLQHDLDKLQEWESDWLMEFHPQKCQVMHISHQKKIIDMPYNIHGHTLESVDSAKYLGLNLHKTLSWNEHINTTVNKANNVRAFISRNTYQCPRRTKELCYKTFIRPVMEYGSVIWDPFTKHNINKLEMVQRRSARYVMGDYHRTSSVTDMLKQLNWPSLQERRAQARAVMMYRIVYHIIDIPPVQLIPTTTLRGHSQKFLVPYARTETYKSSFFPDGIRIWNSLPQTVVDSASLDIFRTRLQAVQLR